jgi:hypothetical protein
MMVIIESKTSFVIVQRTSGYNACRYISLKVTYTVLQQKPAGLPSPSARRRLRHLGMFRPVVSALIQATAALAGPMGSPERSIQIVVSFPPASLDILARAIGHPGWPNGGGRK